MLARSCSVNVSSPGAIRPYRTEEHWTIHRAPLAFVAVEEGFLDLPLQCGVNVPAH